MQILSTKDWSLKEIMIFIRQKRSQKTDCEAIVKNIISKIRQEGDEGIIELTKKFDGVELKTLTVAQAEIKEAYSQIDKPTLTALKRAKSNITTFHKTTFTAKEKIVQTEPGVKIWREFRPIEKVGLYIPGGKASYPSTVLMLSIPAKLACCGEVILCTPPDKNGKVSANILVAADLCGVKKIYKVGGAQAIAAMAYGTQTIPRVYKIFGPGNQFVTTAKMLCYGQVDIDMPAGPSEVAVIADKKAKINWVAADLLSQLEHGEDSQAILFTSDLKFAEKVIGEMQSQTTKLSRKQIIEKAFSKSFAVIYKSESELYQLVNDYAPEHLEIISKDEQEILKNINNVGSVFLGEYSSEPLGDYITGANHTLPTSEFAKMFSPLSTDSFGKMIQIQKVSKKGITSLKNSVETLALSEGLDAHKNSISIRFT
ncbi:MAG: histidinol dehydrogenase [Patescibacteria group bacterium]